MVDNSIFYESGRRIKEKREELGMTMEELGNHLGINRSTIKRYEDGSTKRITIATFEKLAEILNTSPKYLMGAPVDASVSKINNDKTNSTEDNKVISLGKLHPIPILGMIRAGMPIVANEEILGYTYLDQGDWDNYFALKVMGDSMNAARIFDGDIVVCKKQNYIENGEIAVVLIENEDATIKRVYYNDHIVTLMPQSTNNSYQPITVDVKQTKFIVLGKVIKVEFNLY